jgi:hypothetical protein
MDNKRSLPVVDIVILFLAFLLANLRALVFSSLFPDPHVFPGAAWLEIAWWIFTVLMMARILRRLNRVDDFGIIWRRNWPLGLFVFFALISVFWSLDFYTTLFRALELLLATLVASYIGMRFRPVQFSVFLFWFGAILLILTFETVFVFPGAGRMFQPPYNGACLLA